MGFFMQEVQNIHIKIAHTQFKKILYLISFKTNNWLCVESFPFTYRKNDKLFSI
jgi:hypothetical protein